jgi:hypothetical protein
VFTALALTAHSTTAQSKPGSHGAVVKLDRQALQEHLRALGRRAHGGIPVSKLNSPAANVQSLPYFSSSFSVNGVTYPYTMLGYPPASGQTAHLHSVIVPLRMSFVGFGRQGEISVDFDPSVAVANIVASPIYQNAPFPNGVGQFGDMLQRTTFWNRMDAEKQWHVRMAAPRVMPTVDIEVTPETGILYQDSSGNYFGDVLFSFIDAEAYTIIQLKANDPDVLPIFVTQNVTAEALGYHSAYFVSTPGGGEAVQTYIYTSWLDPSLVDPLFADISTINHEVGEWLNDPFISNLVPDWKYPPPGDPRVSCSHNPFLEVGDPQGNGATFDDFPTVIIVLNGFAYHLQQLVMLPWFADEVPSSAQAGWYTYPAPEDLTVPAKYCK